MRRFVALGKVVLAGVISLGILSLFVLVYDYSGIHISNPSGATDYKWNPYQFKTTMSEGFSWLRLDEDGFNNRSVPGTVDVLIMGSSHMEAINVPRNGNTAACLSKLLQEWSIYNIGISGHQIYQCARNMKAAVETYSPDRYVVVETDSVALDNAKMEQTISGELPIIPSYDSGLLYYIQKYCPAIKNLYKQVDNWINIGEMGAPDIEIVETDRTVLNRFLEEMKADCGNNRKLVIVYHPTTLINAEGKLILPDESDTKRFASACQKADIRFIDMTRSMAQLYDEQKILAHGFINTAVGEGHLNEYGHRLIAQQLADAFMEDQNR